MTLKALAGAVFVLNTPYFVLCRSETNIRRALFLPVAKIRGRVGFATFSGYTGFHGTTSGFFSLIELGFTSLAAAIIAAHQDWSERMDATVG